MPDRRDKADDAITQLSGLALGAIIAFVVGLFAGKQATEAREQTITLSDTLEVDHDKIYVFPTKGDFWARWSFKRRMYLYVIVVAGFHTVIICVSAPLMLLHPSFLPLERIAISCGILLMGLGLGLFTRITWGKYKRETSEIRVKLGIDQPKAGKFKVKPFDFANARAYTIALPKTTEWQAQTAGHFMQDILVKLGGRLTFQIVAEPGRIVWRIVDLRQAVDSLSVKQAIHAFYPHAEIVESGFYLSDFTAPFYRNIATFRQEANFIFPILKVEELNKFDPLINITQEMSVLESGERIVYTLFVADFAKFVHDQAEALLTRKLPALNLVEKGFDIGSGGRWENRYEPNVQTMVEEKLQNIVYQCLLLVEVNTPNRQRLEVLAYLQSHLLQYKSFNLLGRQPEELGNIIHYVDSLSKHGATSTIGVLASWLTNANMSWQSFRLLLDTRELASLWHLPHEGFTSPNIEWVQRKYVPLPTLMQGKKEGSYLGLNRSNGRLHPVYMLPKDRQGHMIIVGKTGMGKSTLLHNLIRQDIAAGRGVAVIDPSPKDKNLVPRILRCSIPKERMQDVVVLDLSDRDIPPLFNILSAPKTVLRKDAVASIRAIFERVYGDEFSERRMGRTFRMALHAVLTDDHPTVRDVARVSMDLDYREHCLEYVSSEGALDFWERFGKLTPREQDSYFDPILGRLEVFYDNDLLYPAVCHPDPLDLGTYIQQGKIILIALCPPDNVGLAPSEQALLGSILVSQFQLAVMAQRPSERFFLYVDEAQHFVTTALHELFNEARGQNLSLTLSNQFLKQLAGNTLHAIMGNVGAIVSYQVGTDDAHTLTTDVMKPHFSSYDLVHMEIHDAAVSMRYNDKQQEPFSLIGQDVPSEPTDAARREAEIRELSRQQYTPKNRQEISAWLANRYPRKQWERKTRTDEDQFSEEL